MGDNGRTPSIEQQLRSFIAENILFSDQFPYPDETSFLESGIVDSMNIMEIVLHTEKAFGVSIDDHEIVPANFDSVRNIAAFVRQKVAQAA